MEDHTEHQVFDEERAGTDGQPQPRSAGLSGRAHGTEKQQGYRVTRRTGEAMDRSTVRETLAGKAWRWSRTSYASIDSIGSFLSILSLFSAGSVLSIASAGSLLSLGSTGSLLSIGSVGSILSIGSAGSILSIGGLGLFPAKQRR